MKKQGIFLLTFIALYFLMCLPLSAQTGTGGLRGKIIDTEGLQLIGATIYIDAINMGTIADVNGNYQLMGIPSGIHNVRFTYVGYEDDIREVEIIRGDILVLDIRLALATTGMAEVVIYGQAVGQHAAIQQQLNASGIMNSVSAEKLRELPDVNVAEAIGRLPGLMVERNRGEGQKIIIRGLAPKYNTISIGGNMVPSTSPDDRSTDLNMISPEILGGVEVLKANTADKDADGLGGTVNLTLREAPSGLQVNAGLQSGYSGHSGNISNYRGTLHMSNRFFDNKLGVMLSGNAEMAERNSDRFRVSYTVQGVPDYEAGQTFIKPWITSAEMQANIEDRTRAGGSLLLDWKLSPATTIKSNNFVGYLNRDIYDRSKQYSLTSNYINIRQFQDNIKQLLYSNSLEGEHLIAGTTINWGASRSQSINNKPEGHRVDFRNLSAFTGYSQGNSFDVEPPELVPSPENLNEFTDRYYFYDGRVETYESNETEIGAFLDWEIPIRFGDFVNGFVKAGGKYRIKDRSRINELSIRRLDFASEVNSFMQAYPDYLLTTQGVVGKISMMNFLDESYTPGTFLNDDYELLGVDVVLDRDKISTLYNDYLKDYYHFIPAGAQDDYKTNESILASYAMAEINFGRFVTFIPGVRFEKTDIKYEAFIAESIPDDITLPGDVQFRDTLSSNNYSHILPQIHLRIKPTRWFDIRMAYTNTLSRPDYNQLAPKLIINNTSRRVTLGNTMLKPALSKNLDLILTFFEPKFGLLTLGAFHKDIEGFLWNREAIIVVNTATDPDAMGIPRSTLGYTVRYPMNNANRSTIKGLEFDLQSNLNFLPIKGFVFNANVTLMESQTKYAETLIVRAANPDFGVIPGVPRVILTNRDTAYADRLLSQPSYLMNFGLGYDNRAIGLSVRLSFNYQDDILTREQRRPDGADREGTLEFYRWDFQVNQRITKRLSLNANVANIMNQPDRSVRLITGYVSNLEYYGFLAQFGIKYDVF
jgi:TonB-dependent receptor